MPPIQAIHTPTNRFLRWDYFKNLASIICSRESTYRTALDITAFDLPLMTADAFRGIKKFLESALECLSATVMVGIAPLITTFVGKIVGKFILPTDMQKDSVNLLKFTMNEIRTKEGFKNGVKRIKEEEPQDKRFIASLYERTRKHETAKHYKKEAEEITKFCDNFKTSEEKRKLIYKLKKATIIGESFIEGGWWGGYGLLLRAFRKYILKEERFTGTKGYASDEESAQLGESGDLTLFQKIFGTASIFVSPLINSILLTKAEDDKAVEKSKFLQTVRNHLDMTHGVYPKLGMLFSITTLPKWFGIVTTAQGWYERIERILKLLTVIPSWWMGHRVTNGLFALNADEELAKKHNIKQGVLVEPEYLKSSKADSFFTKLNKKYPEPARIHHVMKATEGNKKLQDEAEDLHAKSLYKGFAAHSAIVWVINMAVNYITKLRVQHALGK